MASLGWRTPVEWLIGTTPDISSLLQFIFWEPVYYFAVEPKVGYTPELLGRFVGISENVGHAMTYKILTESDKVICRAEVRTALKEGAFDNKRAKEAAPTKAPGPDVIEVNIPLEPGVSLAADSWRNSRKLESCRKNWNPNSPGSMIPHVPVLGLEVNRDHFEFPFAKKRLHDWGRNLCQLSVKNFILLSAQHL